MCLLLFTSLMNKYVSEEAVLESSRKCSTKLFHTCSLKPREITDEIHFLVKLQFAILLRLNSGTNFQGF